MIKEKSKILLVDDDPSNIEIMIDIIESNEDSHILYQAPDGERALEIAMKELPNLIISDWEMPEMNGIELIRELKKNESTADIPVIMATGVMTTSENLKTALEAGAADYVRKPIDKIELIARINSMLELSRSYRQVKQLNVTKDRFFSIIAHDLKNPFHVLMGYGEILFEQLEHKEYEDMKEGIRSIYNTSKNSYSLLINLLEWSRSQMGIIKYYPLIISLRDIAVDVIELINSQADRKNIVISHNIPAEIEVRADLNMLQTILRNLLSNAVKYTPEGGKIHFTAAAGSDSVAITIEDNGIGMTDEEMKKLFKIESIISKPGTNKEQGTGLGLLLCKEFIENQGGDISVKSEPGRGSKFTFTLPKG